MKLSDFWKKISQFLSILWGKRKIRNSIYSFLIVIILLLGLQAAIWNPPADFPTGSVFTVNIGDSLSTTASQLSKQNIISSEFWLKSFLILFGGSKGLKAGDYVLNEKQSVYSLAYRLSQGDYRLTPIKITFPEGLNIFEMAKLITQKFSKISEKDFIDKSKNYEGYLFPDTYFFLPNMTADNIINDTNKNFQIKIKPIENEITNFNKSLADVVKMASIVEEEGRTTETRKIIAGILWKRLSLGMLLQVDSSFKYINGKTTTDLTLNDLKINSPYNSYLYKGLPPTPISNPGLDSVIATINPIKTDYLFFLTDKEGNMHYAKTYNEHLRNKELYLDGK